MSDELAFGLWNIGCAEGEITERVASSLDAVGLAGFEDREVPSLSGGELQRLVLASVLAMEPGYLVLDEVTSQIDSTFRSQFRSLVARLAGRGVGVVLVTHDPLEVLSCNRVLVLDAGKVIWSGAPGSLLVDYRDIWDWVLPPNDYADALRCAVADGFDLAGGFAPAQLATWLRSVRADVRSGAGSRSMPVEILTLVVLPGGIWTTTSFLGEIWTMPSLPGTIRTLTALPGVIRTLRRLKMAKYRPTREPMSESRLTTGAVSEFRPKTAPMYESRPTTESISESCPRMIPIPRFRLMAPGLSARYLETIVELKASLRAKRAPWHSATSPLPMKTRKC